MNESLKDTLVHASRPVRFAAAVALTVLALFLLVKTADAISRFGLADNAPVNTITVTGTGKASTAPTIAHVSFTVQETGAVISEVQATATKKTDAALLALKEMSIDEKDITTSGYSVSPQYENAQPCYGGMCPPASSKIIGYQVSQSVEVKVRDVSKAGEVLGKLGTAGVQNISGPNFMVDDDSTVKDEAREMAIKEAQAKARILAKQLHVDLGSVVSFAETSGGYPMPMYSKAGAMMDLAEVSAPTLPVGTQETNMTVSITYEIR